MKSVAFISWTLLGGGAERVIVLLSNELVARGYNVKILLTGPRKISIKLDDRVEVISDEFVSAVRISRLIHRFLFLLRQLRSSTADCIISFCADVNVFVLFVNLFCQKKIVVSERADPHAKSWIIQKLMRVFYNFADLVVTQTPDVEEWFPPRIRKKCRVIPNPVGKDLPEPYNGLRSKKIVSSGRLIPTKNFPMLIDAFERIIRDYPDYTLEIFGDGSEHEALQNHVLSKNISDNVIFHAFTENLFGELLDASVYAFASDSEGMPNAVLEALALGIPTVCTDCPIGGPRMMINDHKNGILVPVGDVDALYLAIKELLDNPLLMQKFSLEGQLLRDAFSVKKITDLWLEQLGAI